MKVKDLKAWLEGLELGQVVEVLEALSAELQERDLHFAAEALDTAAGLLETRLYGRQGRRPP